MVKYGEDMAGASGLYNGGCLRVVHQAASTSKPDQARAFPHCIPKLCVWGMELGIRKLAPKPLKSWL